MTVPANTNALLLRSAAPATYQVSRSLRFSSGDSSYLSRTPASAGNRKTWTWSAWVKRSVGSTDDELFSSDSSDGFVIRFVGSTSAIRVYSNSGGGLQLNLITSAVYRDPSAWYHLVVSVDTTQATASDRAKIYVNGTQVTAFSTAAYPSQNTDLLANQAIAHFIGKNAWGVSGLNGYLADIWFLDGIAATPSDFAETDATTGQWIPKAYAGSKPGNSFHLDFSDNSAATATALGKDSSGNGLNWTPNNFQAGNGLGFTATASASPSGLNVFYDPIANLFDSDDNSYASADYAAGDTTDITVTFNPAIVAGSTLTTKIYQYQTYHSLKVNSGSFVTASGSVVDLLSGYGISAGSSITSITYRTTSPTPSFALGNRWYYIKNNGTNLIYNPAGNDTLVDTPTSYGTGNSGGDVRGNFCTWNPLQSSAATLTNGNLDCTTAVATGAQTRGTIAVSTGKWYWEILVNATVSANNIGIIKTSEALAADRPSYYAGGYCYVGSSGNKENNASASSYGATYGSGDVIGVALDLDAGTLVFYKNGASQGTAFSSLSGEFIPAIGDGTGGSGMDISANFGQRAFAYPVSGFKALCDTNLTAPVIAKPSTVMDVKLYTGNGGSQSISSVGFSPDLVWIKQRSGSATAHSLEDIVRGTSKHLASNATDAEVDVSVYGGGVTAFNSAGFSVGSWGAVNENNQTYVSWLWDAGSSTVTNTQGSITSSVRANASAGFSIVTYTGTGANATIGHGGLVNLANGMIIIKNRSSATNWRVYHSALGNTKVIFLSTTGTPDTNSVYWNNTSPTSTVFSVGSDDGVNGNGNAMVAYCFAPVAGYSSFGSYTGNGSSDGPFVFTGHRSRWLMVKRSDSGANDWYVLDTARSTYNVAINELLLNSSSAENPYTGVDFDLLSNGFKIRATEGSINASGGTFIYASFAENPFQYARAR